MSSQLPDPQPPVAEIVGMSVAVKLDATVTLYDAAGNASDWLKPGVETKMRWHGIPDESQVRSAVKFMQDSVVVPALNDVLASVTERTMQMRQGRY